MANKSKSKRWIWITVLLLIFGGGGYFSLKAFRRTPRKIDPEKLAKVERIDLTRSVVATGKIEAATKVEIKSKASGIIQKLPYDVGDFVREGQVICELDQNDLLPRVREARAAMVMAEAAVASAKADYERNKVDAAGPDVPFLKRDMERARSLFGQGLIAQNARDEAEKKYETGGEPPAVGDCEPGGLQGGDRQGRGPARTGAGCPFPARRRSAQRHDRLADRRRGAVARSRGRRRGQFHPDVGSSATLIMTVGDLSEVYVKGKVDESDIGKIYLGQPARITVESYQRSEIRRQGHEDLADGRREGQRHHLRGARFDLQ